MRLLIGAGTPKEAAARERAFLFVNYRNDTLAILILALDEAPLASSLSSSPPSRHDHNAHIVNGLLEKAELADVDRQPNCAPKLRMRPWSRYRAE